MHEFSPISDRPHETGEPAGQAAQEPTPFEGVIFEIPLSVSSRSALEAKPDDYGEARDAVKGDSAATVAAAFEAIETVRKLPRLVGLIPDHAVEDAQTYAAYDETLASSGLRIEARYPDTLGYETSVKKRDIGAHPTIDDPEIYTRVIADLSPQSAAAEHVRAESGAIVGRTLDRASTIIYRSDYRTVTEPLRKSDSRHRPNLDIRPEIVQAPQEPDAEQLAFVDRLAASAASLGTALQRFEVPESVVSGLQSLAIAHEEGMITDWARLYVAQIVGHDDLSIGRRFRWDWDWDAIEPTLADLQSRVPDARLTQSVRDKLRGDIETGIARLVDGIHEYVNPNTPETSDRWQYSEAAYMHYMPASLALYEECMPALRRALEVMDRVWPSIP